MYARRFLVALPLLFAVACVGGGTGGSAGPEPIPGPGDSEVADAGGSDEEQSSAPADGDGTTTTAKPSAEVEGSCTKDPQPGEEGEELVSELRVVNTGNLGVVVRVSTRWPIGKEEGVGRWSRVRVQQGETVPLTVRMPVYPSVADGVRAALKDGRRCRVRSSVTGAFGIPE